MRSWGENVNREVSELSSGALVTFRGQEEEDG